MDDAPMLAEYRSLREEIVKRQDNRSSLFVYTITVIGTVLGLALREGCGFRQAVGLMCMGQILIVSILVLSVRHCQFINLAAAYIRDHIEVELPSMGWEHHLLRLRERRQFSTATALAFSYSVLATALWAVVFFVDAPSEGSPALVVGGRSLMTALWWTSLALCVYMYTQKPPKAATPDAAAAPAATATARTAPAVSLPADTAAAMREAAAGKDSDAGTSQQG